MDFFDLAHVKYIVVTYENLQTSKIDVTCLDRIGIEPTKWPNMTVFDYTPYQTMLFFNKAIYDCSDDYERLTNFRDISWIDVVMKDGREAKWIVPWDDDTRYEYENRLQINDDYGNGLTVKVRDYLEIE